MYKWSTLSKIIELMIIEKKNPTTCKNKMFNFIIIIHASSLVTDFIYVNKFTGSMS